jgi:class 3 adenylate cyclase/tetratricopeptide (TPR) repeat protein
MQSAAGKDAALPGPTTSPACARTLVEERKYVTILACGLTDAPARAVALGGEGMHALMQTLFAHAQHAVQRYAGTIMQWGGDGFTALFGAPVAYEDHAWRAVLAACDLREHLRQPITLAGQGVPLTLTVTMGLHTGPVIVGELEQAPNHLYTAAGPTTHLVSQLQHLAGPGTLLISDTTYEHVRDAVQVCAWGRLDKTPGTPPCVVYAVQGIAPQCVDVPGRGRGQRSRFVGRERELALLHACLAQARRGQGQVVSVVGEPGIGKSRLFYEFHRQLRDQTVTHYVSRCLSYGSAMPYGPVIHLLREVCGISHLDPTATVATKLQRCLQQVSLESDAWTPYLQQLLGLTAGTAPLATLSPEAVKRRTFTALRHLLLALSQQRPLVLTLEDAHWIDQTSEDFFSTLVESLVRVPALLLVSYRPGYRPPWLDKSYATQLALPPLPAHESQCLVESLVPEQALSVAAVQTLLAKAEGNPFFLEELTRTMLVHGDASTALALPDTIQGILMARMDRLPEPTRRTLHMASVLGRTVSVKLLSTLWKGPGELDDHLETLQHLEFLYAQVGTAEPVYAFKHALTQEVAYSSMLQSQRQALHTTIGQTLETLYADHLDDALEQLAYHYGRGTDAAKAIAYLRQSGAKAARSFAHVEANAAYQQALQHVQGLPTPQQDHTRLDLLLRQTFSLSILGRFREILELLAPQQARLEQLHEPALSGPYYFRLGMTASYLGASNQGLQHAHRALAAARQGHDPVTQGMAYHLLAFAGHALGHYQQSRTYGQKAVALLDKTSEWHWLGLAYWDVGINAAFLGEFDAALEVLTHTRALGAESDDLRLQHLAELSTGWIQIMRGEWEAGMIACQHILACSPDPIIELGALQYLSLAYIEQDDPASAIPLLEHVSQRLQHIQLPFARARTAAFLGEALLASQQIDQAQHMASQALEISQAISYPYGMGLAQRVLGRIAQTGSDSHTAAQRLHEALRTFTALHGQYDMARTHLLLAELAHRQGNRDTGTLHLSEAHRLFQRMHVPKYVARTEQLAEAFAGQELGQGSG